MTRGSEEREEEARSGVGLGEHIARLLGIYHIAIIFQ